LRPSASAPAAATPPFPALNEWKARQATAAAPLREPAPQAVADRLAELARTCGPWRSTWQTPAWPWSARRWKARAELEADRNEATELADKLASDVEALQSRLASIEAAEAAARGEADELRASLTAAQEQAHTAEARAQEIERRAGELRTELDRAHQDADQARGLWPSSRRPAGRRSTRPGAASW
jgi:DNA repair exonuclease SbcCD ATPase subunit